MLGLYVQLLNLWEDNIMNRSNGMHWCDRCHENSVRIKCYDRADGIRSRIAYCINKGCGYRQEIPFPRVEQGVASG